MPYTTINKSSSYFNTKLYTGNGSTLNVTGVGFKPDFVWLKDRSNGNSHKQYDGVRGVTKFLTSDGTEAEGTQSGLTSFDTDGFTLGSYAGTNGNGTAGSGPSYVSWNWLASNTTVSNTSGTITSTVSANTTSGFSIVSYTGNGGTNVSVGHSLGVTPKIVLIKNRSNTSDWYWFTTAIDGSYDFLLLNTTAAKTDSTTNAPTSSFIYANGINNTSSNNYIAYCFTDIKGYSKFGSYTGNGSADGTFVYTGFKPAFVLLKSSSAAYNWHMFDSKRNTYNVVTADLLPNASNAENTSANVLDFVSNGFKLRDGGAGYNDANTYIYMAFAENPFVTSGGIPVTAR